jgi:hypothetical protein
LSVELDLATVGASTDADPGAVRSDHMTVGLEAERLFLEDRRNGSGEVSSQESGVGALHAVKRLFQCDDETTRALQRVSELD